MPLQLLIFLLLFTPPLEASNKPLQEFIYNKIQNIYDSKESLENYFSENRSDFPLSQEPPVVVNVDKKEVEVEGETFTLGKGHFQIFIKAPMTTVVSLLRTTEDYQLIYNLDEPAHLEKVGEEDHRARIFKKLPIVSNQDYVLSYKMKSEGARKLQRATLVKDNEDFALREILAVLTPQENGVMYREISLIYILRWYLRALGPQVRSMTQSELYKLGHAFKCIAEKSASERKLFKTFPPEKKKELAQGCWEAVPEENEKSA